LKYIVQITVAFILCGFSVAFGQEWSAEQKEVWKAVEELVEDFYAGNIKNLNRHPEFVFWNPEKPEPGDKQAATLQDEKLFSSGVKFHDASVAPLTINVHGDFATVNAYIRVSQVLPDQQNSTSITARFHSDWKKEDDTWFNISNFLYREK